MYRLLAATLLVLTSCNAVTETTAGTAEDATPATAGAPSGESAELRHVFDGDSIEVTRADGSVAEIRLVGINAPEGGECHGDVARAHLAALLAEGTLTLVADEDENDQFGRLLRYVYRDAENINLAMVTAGHALALQTGHSKEESFLTAGTAAAEAGTGMWSATACSDAAPLPAVTIEAYEYDPPGRDAANPNDEWVRIGNATSESIALGDWVVRDESTQHRFRFPAGFRLGPGQTVSIHSGCGDETTTDLYWCARDPIWSNGGDTIVLQTPNGTIVAWEQFTGNF